MKKKHRMSWYHMEQRFSLRKYHFGVASVLLGASIMLGAGTVVEAEEQIVPAESVNVVSEIPEQPPVAEVPVVAESVATVANSDDFVREWRQPEDKTINLSQGYSATVTEGQNGNDPVLTNTSVTTVNGNHQELTLRGMSIDNQNQLTVNDTVINTVASAGVANPAITSSGQLTLDGVTMKGTHPDLNVTGGTAVVQNGTSETQFNNITVSNGATLTLEGKQIDAKVLTADETSKVISDSTGIDDYRGGALTLKNLNGEVKVTDVNSLTLEGNSDVILTAGSTITEKLVVPKGTTLKIGDNKLTVKELSGTGTIVMNPTATLTVETLKDAITIAIKNNTADWSPNDKKEYVVVTQLEAEPTVTGEPTPAGKTLKKEGNAWRLVEETSLNFDDLDKLVTDADTSADILNQYNNATSELKNQYDAAFEKANNVLIDATTQDEINEALAELRTVIDELRGETPAETLPLEQPKVTVVEESHDIIYKLTFVESGATTGIIQTNENITIPAKVTKNKDTGAVLNTVDHLTEDTVMKYTLSSLYDFVEIKKVGDSSPYVHDNDQHVYVVVRKKAFNFEDFLAELAIKTAEERYLIAKSAFENPNKTQAELTQEQLDSIETFLDNTAYNNELLKVINEARVKAGINPLNLNEELAKGIEIRAQEQAEVGYIRSIDTNGDGIGDKLHTRPNDTPFGTAFGYMPTVSLRSENAGQYLFTDLRELISEKWHAEKQFERLSTSPEHNANMMNKDYTEAYFAMALSDDHLMLVDDKTQQNREETNGQASIFMQAFGVKRSTRPVVQPIVTIEQIPFETIYKADVNSTKPAGTKVIETDGQVGEVEMTRVNGQETSRRILTPKVDEVILVSVKPTEVRSDIAFERVYDKDDTREAGSLVTVTPGIKGIKRIITNYTVDETTGELMAQEPVEVEAPPVTERITVGTKATEVRKDVAYDIIEVNDLELAKGERLIDVSGQVGVELTVTTYEINPQTGELIEAIRTSLEKAPVSERVRVGSKEIIPEPTPNAVEPIVIAKGTGLVQDIKSEFSLFTSKGTPLVQDIKPELMIETSKGTGVVEEVKPSPSLESEVSKGTSLVQEAKPEFSLFTSKGTPLVQDIKPELMIETSKGTGVVEEVKPSPSLEPDVSKGTSLVQDIKSEFSLFTLKGTPLVQDRKPELMIETSKGTGVVEEAKPEALPTVNQELFNHETGYQFNLNRQTEYNAQYSSNVMASDSDKVNLAQSEEVTLLDDGKEWPDVAMVKATKTESTLPNTGSEENLWTIAGLSLLGILGLTYQPKYRKRK